MNQERWEGVCALFERARLTPFKDRAKLLADACREDVALRGEVESLLREHERATQRFSASLFTVDPPSLDARVPEHIGPYRVLSLLARGGMGEVYLAEQDSPRRRTPPIGSRKGK